MNKKHTFKAGKYLGIACLLFVCAAIQSCRDEYIYDDLDKVPEWLGESIYEELQDGLRDNESPEGWSFKYFLQVIDDCDYKDVLLKTGSKTLFVADDSAFIDGIKKAWGIERYEDLQPGHKRTILYSAMLDNAYLLEMMSSTPASGMGDPNAGECLRRETSADVLDTIYTYSGDQLPQNNPHWDEFRDQNIRMALDNTEPMMVHFLTEQVNKVGITDEDLTYLVDRSDASTSKAYIFDKEVIKRDVTCKNGYINLLDGLLIPPSNMAEEIRKSPELSLYSRILDRFAVPVYNETLSNAYTESLRKTNPEAPAEKVYEKRYFTRNSNRNSFGSGFLTYKDFEGNNHETTEEAALDFSPGWNQYRSQQYAKDVDMAAMFVPTDDALMTYFTIGAGAPLIDRYGNGAPLPQAIDSIDINVISELVRNMMEPSFNQSVPSKFGSLKDDANDDKGVKKDHLYQLRPCIVANNGVVYITEEVYSPAVYVSVSAPAKLNQDMEAMYKIIETEDYNSYLLAMQSEFSFINPTNDALVYYDPVTTYTTTPVTGVTPTTQEPKYYKIGYDPKTTNLSYSEGKHILKNDSLGKATATSSGPFQNIRLEILEHAIVVGNIANGNKYHQTKGYATIKVNHEERINEKGELDTVITHIWGGRELENMLAGKRDNGIPVARTFTQKNGKTYRLEEGLIHPATRSVYNILKTTEEFKHFFALCSPDSCLTIVNSLRPVKETGADAGYAFTENANAQVSPYHIFVDEGLDRNVNSFSTYHYTIYVPNSAAIVKAIDAGLPQWYELRPMATEITNNRNSIKLLNDSLKESGIAAERKNDLTERRKVLIDRNDELREELKGHISLIVNFVKYHMQDNSIYLDNQPVMENGEYGTASKDDETNRFDVLTVTSGSNALTVEDGNGDPHQVVTKEDTENILYNVMARDIEKKNGGVGTSSYAVIHQIEGYLSNPRFKDQMEHYLILRNEDKIYQK